MFSKILIANRGEIAVRIIRACKEMGIATVAVYSEADKNSLHVSLADESCCIGKDAPQDSYLNMNNIIAAAKGYNAEAIHPGCGFLSKNPDFSNLCEENSIVFIGPKTSVMTQISDKDMIYKTMQSADVPVLPRSEILKNITNAKKEAKKIGFPLLVKVQGGDNNRDTFVVNALSELESQYQLAVQEASATGSAALVYMEKFLNDVKCIEVQIMADNFGNILCLGERDCSMQWDKQKLVIESPSPVINTELRQFLTEISIKAANAIDYQGIGSIKYLYDQKNNQFYFMKMDTSLQTEHPVTEFVTGIDLVKWQIRIAANVPLKYTQEDIKLNGHAIECNIIAEDTLKFSSGKINMLHVPGGPLVRFDSAIYNGYFMPTFYDAIIGKLIVASQSTRCSAISKMKAALEELVISGIDNNSDLQMNIMDYPEFVEGSYTTASLEKLMF